MATATNNEVRPKRSVKTVLQLPESLVRKMAKVCKQSQLDGNVDEVYAKFLSLSLELWETRASDEEFWAS